MTGCLAALRLDRRFIAWAIAWALVSLLAFGEASVRRGPGDPGGASIKPQGNEAPRHVRFSWTSCRPLAVQAVMPPSRLSMFV